MLACRLEKGSIEFSKLIKSSRKDIVTKKSNDYLWNNLRFKQLDIAIELIPLTLILESQHITKQDKIEQIARGLIQN